MIYQTRMANPFVVVVFTYKILMMNPQRFQLYKYTVIIFIYGVFEESFKGLSMTGTGK